MSSREAKETPQFYTSLHLLQHTETFYTDELDWMR